jgi:hypothetical protein
MRFLLSLTLYVEVSLVSLATLNIATAALGRSAGGDSTALGVFFRFQVTDFDRLLGFFSLCHFIFPSYLFWVCFSLCCVGDTER